MLLRSRIPELMDDPRLDRELHLEALRDLQFINKISGSAQILWSELNKFSAEENQTKPIRVLDIATGSGDILVELARLAKQNNRQIEFTGADISATAIEHAQNKAKSANTQIRFEELDVIKNKIPEGFDVVMTSLFTHHLDPDEVVQLFKNMRESEARMILVNDLVRSKLSYSLVWLATRLFTRSPVVHFDGPVSVRAAYTPEEMRSMAVSAGLDTATVKPFPPCRQLLVWRRD
jgi:2-polyprenyl-3-methyl-5-hydroxy-6-metoxy-1,4-benzoquinol methylase